VIVINHTDVDAEVAVAGRELLTDTACGPTLVVRAGDVRVVRCREGDPS
jgi:hypothetical protein